MSESSLLPSGLSLGPRSIERSAPGGYTLVGALDDSNPARVDGAGLVQPRGAGWSVDWWIGADDRWYFPARESTIRQRRLGAGPVLETALRIPSGDAVHRCYPVLIGGRSATVVEIENDSPVPVALAIAIRPYGIDGASSHGDIAIADDHVRVGGEVALSLPRRANERLATNRDAVDIVAAGKSLSGAAEAAGERPNGVVLYPLPHRTRLRFVVGAADRVVRPSSVPDHESVQRGWTSVVEGGGRFEFPDNGLSDRAAGARARLVIDGDHLAGDVAALAPGAGRVLHGLVTSGATNEVRLVLLTLASAFPARLDVDPASAAAVVLAAGHGLAALDDKELADDLLEVLARLTQLVERSGDHDAAAEAFEGLAWSLRAADQRGPADDLFTKAASRADGGPSADVPSGLDRVTDAAERASSAGSWGDDDVVDAACFWLGARALAMTERPDGLDLLPDFPAAWRGGNVEVHRALTAHGRVSFAVRWHGYRPALLWELDVRRPVVLRCPALDPSWSTTDSNGEALLAGASDDLPGPPGAGESFG